MKDERMMDIYFNVERYYAFLENEQTWVSVKK